MHIISFQSFINPWKHPKKLECIVQSISTSVHFSTEKKIFFSGTAFFITKMKVSIQILTRLKIKPFAGKHTVPLCSIAHLWCYHNPENNVLPVSMYSVPKTTSAFFEWKCNSNFINWKGYEWKSLRILKFIFFQRYSSTYFKSKRQFLKTFKSEISYDSYKSETKYS